jgi:hypothetical protein
MRAGDDRIDASESRRNSRQRHGCADHHIRVAAAYEIAVEKTTALPVERRVGVVGRFGLGGRRRTDEDFIAVPTKSAQQRGPGRAGRRDHQR